MIGDEHRTVWGGGSKVKIVTHSDFWMSGSEDLYASTRSVKNE